MLTGKLPRGAAAWPVAHVLARIEEYAFDYIFYPYMLYEGGDILARAVWDESGSSMTGYWTGFAVLFLTSLVVNVLYVRVYDRSRRDWFGFEYLRGRAAASRFATSRVVPLVRIGTFCYLSVWHSPLFATLCLRSGDRQFAMTRGDWCLFGMAVFVANAGWALVVTAAVSAIRALLGDMPF